MRCPKCNKPLKFNQDIDNALDCSACHAVIVIKKVTWDNGDYVKTFEYAEMDADPELIEE